MNPEKLKALQAKSEQVRTGGKGSMRRKKKVIHRTAATDDKKLQTSLKKLGVNNIPGIEEVNMIRDDGTVIHFTNPKVQASLAANTFSINGQAENKRKSLSFQCSLLQVYLYLHRPVYVGHESEQFIIWIGGFTATPIFRWVEQYYSAQQVLYPKQGNLAGKSSSCWLILFIYR